MSFRLTITIDDDDREDAPERPYVAWSSDLENSGIGATPAEALQDLLNDARREIDSLLTQASV